MRIIAEGTIQVETFVDNYVVTELRYQRAKESLVRHVLMISGHLITPIFLIVAGVAVWYGFTYSSSVSCRRIPITDSIEGVANSANVNDTTQATEITTECQASRDYLLHSDEVIVPWQPVSGINLVSSHDTCFGELILPSNQSIPLSYFSSSTQCVASNKIRKLDRYIQLPRRYWDSNSSQAKSVSFGGSFLSLVGGGVLLFFGVAWIKYMMLPWLLTQIIIDKNRRLIRIYYLTIFGSHERVIKFADIIDIVFLAKLNSDTEKMKVQKHIIQLANSKPIDVLICYDYDEMLTVHQEMKQWVGLS